MTGFVMRRLGQALFVAWLVSLVVFVLTRSLPGGAAKATLGKEATAAQIAEFNHQQGFDRSIPEQYWIWISRVVQGDFGYSYRLNMPVSSAIANALPKTMLLVGLATAVSLLVAIPLGSVQAIRRGKPFDRLIGACSFLVYATPTFLIGLMLILVMAVEFQVFPSSAPTSDSLVTILGSPQGMVLPVLTLALGNIALYARYMRSSMSETLTSDFVRTARAKGLSRAQVLARHAVPNSLRSVVTIVGFSIPGLLAGSVVVEQVFNYPGMGMLFWTAAQYNDYPTQLAIVLLVSVATVLGSLVADIAYRLLDPRVSYERV